MMPIRVLGVSLIAAVLVAAVAGCENPALQKRWARRADNLDRTADRIARIENGRQERFQATADVFARQYERDVANTRQDPGRVRQWFQRDVDRWPERRVSHRQRLDEQLGGDPANIERTIPKILD